MFLPNEHRMETGIERHWREQEESAAAKRLAETPGIRIRLAQETSEPFGVSQPIPESTKRQKEATTPKKRILMHGAKP